MLHHELGEGPRDPSNVSDEICTSSQCKTTQGLEQSAEHITNLHKFMTRGKDDVSFVKELFKIQQV